MPEPDQPQHRRSTLDFSGGQSGDHTSRDAAGRDIHQSGADPAQVFDLVRYFWADQQQRELRQQALDRQFEALRNEINLYRVATVQRLDRVDKSMRRLTYLCVSLIVAWLLGLVVLVWLVVDHAAALSALRIISGAAAASVAAWRVGR